MSNNDAAMAVLEEVIERAIEECREARSNGNDARAMALFEVVDNAMTQATVAGLGQFSNHSLNGFDPYSLLTPQRKAA